MTREGETPIEKLSTVLSLDICSSTDILEDLHRTDNVACWRALLIQLKRFLREEGTQFPFELYNFTGDGWLILFDHDVDGAKLIPFLRRLCRTYGRLYREKIRPVLETQAELVGITMGMDRGRLIKIRMNERDEYVGRPLNVACRLQGAIKDRDSHPANKLLMTKHLFNTIKDDTRKWEFKEVNRTLRNIAGGRTVSCMKLECG